MFLTRPGLYEYTAFIDATLPRLLPLPFLLPQMYMYCSLGVTVHSELRYMYSGTSLI